MDVNQVYTIGIDDIMDEQCEDRNCSMAGEIFPFEIEKNSLDNSLGR